MAVIWWLSSDAGSAHHTSGIVGWIVTLLVPWATPAEIALVHALVRKLGHLTEYAILAILWFRALHVGRGLTPILSTLTALAISVAWAIIDEFHQSFVPSRTSTSLDVLIDITGATLALLVLYACTARTATKRALRVVPTPHLSE